MTEIQVLTEGDGDILLLVTQLGEHGNKDLGGIGTGGLFDTHVGDTLQDGLPTLLLIVGQLLVAEVRTGETYVLLDVLLINLRTGHHHLWIGEDNGNLITAAMKSMVKNILLKLLKTLF